MTATRMESPTLCLTPTSCMVVDGNSCNDSPPPTPRISKKLLNRGHIMDHLELLQAPPLDAASILTCDRPSFDRSFGASQSSFYRGLNKKRGGGAALERLRQQAERSRNNLVSCNSEDDEELSQEMTYNQDINADFMTPTLEETSRRTVGQMIIETEESPTGVMDFVMPPFIGDDKPSKNGARSSSRPQGFPTLGAL